MDKPSVAASNRVLVVDDEPGLRQMVAEYLGRHGFIVSTAESGADLDRQISEMVPDFVLLDVTMPEEDGFSIARRLRAAHPGLPIILLTALDEVVDRVVGLEAGADDYMTKPFDLRELRARIQAVTRRTRTNGAALPTSAVSALGPASSRFLVGNDRPVIEKPFTPNDIRQNVAAILALSAKGI
jgi:DNA-binding response OmpR family regulator